MSLGASADDILHVLWTWDARLRDWRERARITSYRDDWVRNVAPVVRRSLLESMNGVEPPKPARDVQPAARRIADFIEEQLAQFSRADIGRALDMVHSDLARRIVRSQLLYSRGAVEESGVDCSPLPAVGRNSRAS